MVCVRFDNRMHPESCPRAPGPRASGRIRDGRTRMNLTAVCFLALTAWAGVRGALAAPPTARAPAALPMHVPRVLPGRSVLYVAVDFRNGGAMGVFRGLEDAARRVGWKLSLVDGQGSPQAIRAALTQALSHPPDAVVLGGFDAAPYAEVLARLRRRHVVLVGWHAGARAGAVAGLSCNVTTPPKEVARLAAEEVMRDAAARRRTVGAVIFTDDSFSIARAKTAVMQRALEHCAPGLRCRVLAVENVPIARAATLLPRRVAELAARLGKAWTYCLAINDVYFDNMEFPLLVAGRPDIAGVAAGDGSFKAISRIRSGRSVQIATVAEPLQAQGYQLLDDIQRELDSRPCGAFVAAPAVLTYRALLRRAHAGGDEALRRWYLRQWRSPP